MGRFPSDRVSRAIAAAAVLLIHAALGWFFLSTRAPLRTVARSQQWRSQSR